LETEEGCNPDNDDKDKGLLKVSKTKELDVEDINNLSEEDEDNQYTSKLCQQTLAKVRKQN
jgi:hypothetical protein